MKKIMKRLFTMTLLAMVSMGAWADVDVQIANDGKFDGGTIKYVGQTKPDEKGLVTVTITVTPDKGYTIKSTDITVVSTYAPGSSATRNDAPQIAANLTLLGKDPEDLGKERNYTFIVSSTFGAWVKEANFQADSKGGGDRNITYEEITSLSDITNPAGHYKIVTESDIDATNYTSIEAFTGTLTAQAKADGTFPVIKNLSVPLFTTATGASISNIIFKEITISGSGPIGAICGTANGATRIYNCGVLPKYSFFNDKTRTESSTVSSSDGYCGSLVGQLSGNARVINCFSYATIAGGTTVAGIVGYIGNTQITQDKITTVPMVVNCMFYGEISGGSSKYPVYGGAMIKNERDNGVNPYCYFRKNATFDNAYNSIDNYNRSWPAEEKNLTRFEYYRSILNSNKRLCTYWVTDKVYGSEDAPTEADEALIAKWVLDPSIAPYPILKKWGKYPSVININPDKVWDPRTEDEDGNTLNPKWVDRSKANEWEGKSYGTLTVYVNPGTHHTADQVTKTITITDMDTLNCDYGYYKIQLPYYNEVFGNPNGATHAEKYGDNYGEYVVTGWDITNVDGGTAGTFDGSSNHAWKDGFNFADRNCTSKDLYATSGRVFAQGGYYYVPEGVNSITITAHWGKAFYLANRGYNIDRVKLTIAKKFKEDKSFTPAGTVANTFQGQTVYNDLQEVIKALDVVSSDQNKKVCDQAIVLIGNHQVQNGSNKIGYGLDSKWHPHTIMSADFDFDNEPDFCLEWQFRGDTGRPGIQPVRFDFLPVVELGLAVRHDNKAYAIGIFVPQGHFEMTETSFMRTTQFEYDGPKDDDNRVSGKSPVIINGGEFELFNIRYHDANRTSYFLLGGKAWIHRFAPGAHPSQNTSKNYNCVVNAIGGEYPEFYLSGIYRPETAAPNDQASPHCYTNGGKFGIMAGAGYDKVKNGVTFKINHSLINEFYGGGINGTNPLGGDIDVTIDNSRVTKYCGGPKVGNMTGKKVTTHATNTTFGVFFGGGNGGNSYYRHLQRDGNFASSHIGIWTDQSFNWNGFKPLKVKDDGTDNKGYHAEYEFEVFNESNGVEDQITQRGFINWIQFGITITGDVKSTLTNCTVKTNFYGGGNLATVNGNVTSTLTNTKVYGNAFGAGYSAAIPTFSIHDKDNKTFPSMDFAGTITDGSIPYVKDGDNIRKYEWTNDLNGKTEEERKADPAYQKDGKWYCYTWNKLENLGAVTGNVSLTIDGNTTLTDGKIMSVAKSVYGGGEESAVDGSTVISVTGGTIGTQKEDGTYLGGADYGNVYGGGKGLANSVTAGLVKGNTNVTISGTPQIYHNIYGGGAYGSVGEFDYDNTTGMPTGRKSGTSGGTCTVTIEGGTIGVNGKENGMVFGSSRGDVSAPVGNPAVDPNDKLAWVYETNVIIGGEGKDPQIKGSVYGSGENGHTFNNTQVDIHSGTIGITDTNTDGGARYPYRGNVYGGGCGTDMYDSNGDNVDDTYNLNAGIVLGNTTVTIDGGHVVHSVYGGGAMGSVGKFTLDTDGTNIIPDGKPISCAANTGLCTVTISGGTIGNEGASMKTAGGPDDFGHVFGAGRGETRDTTVYKNLPLVGYVNKTIVTIGGSAFITGSVYGGAENSHVLGNTDVTIQENCQIGNGEGVNRLYTTDEWASASLKECAHWDYKDAYSPYDIYAGNQPSDALSGAANPATDGHTFYGNVFGGGSGYYPYEAGKWVRSAGLVEGNTTVKITGGHILSNVYGGNEHTDVYGKCTVTMSGGTVGVPMTYTDKRNHPVTGNLFGAGKGDKRVLFNTWTNVASTNVTVSGGTIYGSVFGGGEDGHVLGDATTTITQAEGKTTIIGTLGTTGYDGNVFGGGRGSYTALTAGVVCGNTEVNIDGGLMMGSVYGGGRLASVGTHLVPPTASGSSDESHPYYGKLIPDGKRQIIGQEDVDASDITHGHTVIKITGGKIGYDKAGNLISSSFSTGDVFGACKGTTNGSFATQQSGYDPTTQAQAMLGVSKSSLVNLLGGIVGNSIYGGGELGNIGTSGSTETFFAKINLLGGQVKNVYGGGLGQKKIGETVPAAETLVMGDVKVNLNGLEENDYDATTHSTFVGRIRGDNSYLATSGCVVTGNIFGCNNLNGTPLGHAKVHVFKTMPQKAEPEETDYDVAAVYGGGNQADYKPTDTQQSTEVIIEGCDLSKIEYVYGGGNAAASPATSVLIMGSKHIKYIFGGGNGAGENNPGANVGYYTDKTEYKDSQGNYLGDGKALVKLMAGNVDYIYGGSNSVGDIRGGSSVTNIDNTNDPGCCAELIYKDIYGGGKDADMSGPANIIFTCTNSTSWGNDIYPGAENANIGGDVTITITSGKFKRVFGGNKYTGKIHGSITINIEENGKCGTPVIIGELYGGGNKAPYSVYGYDDNGNMLTSGTQKYANPQINVRAFTSIGNIYGGGLGSGAVMYGSPTVNINEVGFNKDAEGYQSNAYNGENVNVGQDEDAATVTLHPHTNGAMGVIDKIFGGGNAAKVEGNTTVNVGTTEYEYLLVTDELTVGTTDVSGYYTRSNTGTTVNPIFTYTKVADGTKAAAETNYYRQNAVKGADIRGNVYGGGNKAEVTGNTNVNIGQ